MSEYTPARVRALVDLHRMGRPFELATKPMPTDAELLADALKLNNELQQQHDADQKEIERLRGLVDDKQQEIDALQDTVCAAMGGGL